MGYELMSVFIEIAEGKENNLDLAKVMAEMFKLGDKNKDEVLELAEFKAGMVEHPVTGKILREKSLDSLLATMLRLAACHHVRLADWHHVRLAARYNVIPNYCRDKNQQSSQVFNKILKKRFF